jgi:hypothetical protein
MVPKMPKGTLTRNTARQLVSASSPPISSPMNEPVRAATWLMPRAMPRWLTGKASVRMAMELAISRALPTPWTIRRPISSSAPAPPTFGVKARAIEATVKMAKPALYILTRP